MRKLNFLVYFLFITNLLGLSPVFSSDQSLKDQELGNSSFKLPFQAPSKDYALTMAEDFYQRFMIHKPSEPHEDKELIQETNRYIDFCDDSLENLAQFAGKHSNLREREVINAGLLATKANKMSAESVKEMLQIYYDGKISDEGILKFFLVSRLAYLEERTQPVENAILRGAQDIIVPTDPIMFQRILEAAPEYKEYNKFVRQETVDRYEYMQRVILKVFSLVDRKTDRNKFDSLTKDLLRASVTLHPLLRGETTDLGHPDQAGGNYVARPGVQKYLDNQLRISTKFGNLSKKITADVYYFRNHFNKLMTSSVDKKGRKKTAFEAEKTDTILPLPSFESIFTGKENVTFDKTALDELLKDINKKSKNKRKKQIKASSKSVEPVFNPDPEEKKKEAIPSSSSVAPIVDEKPSTSQKIAEKSQAKTQPQATKISSQNEENEDFWSFLSGKHFKVKEEVLELKAGIKFSDFSSLWTHLGGEIKFAGGSHCALLYQGMTLGRTYRPHPEPTFGKKTVKQLKEALEAYQKIKA